MLKLLGNLLIKLGLQCALLSAGPNLSIGCFQTGPWRGQWVQRAIRRAGGNGRQVASRNLQAGGGYGAIGQQN
jgi:hypothetical protein